MTKTKIFVFTVVALVILASIVLFAKKISNNTLPQSVLEPFAKCLASKNLTMYGAEWCSHCQREKSLFGDASKFVPYVECPENQKLCLDLGIEGYPTWIDATGNKYPGEQGLEGLQKISGCPLPSIK